jgi:predicted nucleic acid-binding protein
VIVVDASVLINALVYGEDRGRRARGVLARDVEWVAPELWKAEVFSGLRGLVLRGEIAVATAERTVARLPNLGIETVSIDPLLTRMWGMRDVVSGYDAAYVALATSRGLTLVTADARLAKAATAYCRVELA